ncbi:Hypp3089 [Branchiostoma lanceolatum]|nr:Hypp3089 [Branchiostoma lanceolatum]
MNNLRRSLRNVLKIGKRKKSRLDSQTQNGEREGNTEYHRTEHSLDMSRQRRKSAGLVMSGPSRFGPTRSDEDSGRGQSLSVCTDPNGSIRRQWTTEWVGQLGDRNDGNEFSSFASLPPIRTQGELRPVSRQKSDLGAGQRSSSSCSSGSPMTMASWLQHHAWSSDSRTEGFWRYPLHHRDRYADGTTHWQPRGCRKSGSADPLSSLHEESRAQQTRLNDESDRGQGYRHPSSRRQQSRSERPDPGVRDRTRTWVSNNRTRGRRRYNTKRYARRQPTKQATVKKDTKENDSGNTGTEQEEECKSPGNESFMEWIINVLRTAFRGNIGETPPEAMSGALLAGDEEKDTKALMISDGGQDEKDNTQEKMAETPGDCTLSAAVFGALSEGDKEDDNETYVNSHGRQDDKRNTQEKKTEPTGLLGSIRCSLSVAVFGAVLAKDAEDDPNTIVNSNGRQDDKSNTHGNNNRSEN